MPANQDKSGKTIGFIAHMDTSPDYNGANVNPRIISAYDGKDIELGEGVVTRIKDFPKMSEHAGHGGNECGVFKALNPKLDIITFGPKGTDVHTPNEKLSLDSFERSYQMLKDMISACK